MTTEFQEELEAALSAAEILWDGLTRHELENALSEILPVMEERNDNRFQILAYFDDGLGHQIKL